jgi:hypothetical protein
MCLNPEVHNIFEINCLPSEVGRELIYYLKNWKIRKKGIDPVFST